jgi:hypothetical protein
MDEGAFFRIHSASKYEGGLNKEEVDDLKKNPDETLVRIARSEQIDQRYTALRLVTLFQNTLLIPTRAEPRPESDPDFCSWAGGEYVSDDYRGGGCVTRNRPPVATRLAYVEAGNPQRAADVARIRREGAAAYQDILMRIERDCMGYAISDIEATISERGPRAKPALNMIRAMFTTSILDTSYMSHTQLVTMGYVTPTLNLSR